MFAVMENALLLGLGAAALLVRVGLALYFAGQSRSKNSAASMMRTSADFCFSVLAFALVGAALMNQVSNPLFGLNPRRLLGGGGDARWFFQAVALLTATGTLAGATAERSRFWGTCAGSILLAGLILPVGAHWAWYGWLSRLGFTDVAGATALHVSTAVAAVVATIFIGPRKGKFNRDGSSNMILGHSIPMACAGTSVMLVGWVAYTAGSVVRFQFSVDTLGASAANTILAAAAGGAAALFAGQVRYGKPDVSFLLAGLLGALVAISAPSGLVGSGSAIVIGAVAGVIVPFATVMLDLQLRIDDPGGMIAVQLVGGVWGTLAASIVPSRTGGFFRHLIVQCAGIAAIVLLSGVFATALYWTLRATVGLRLREADEFDGLDLAEHDIGAYPDFQQNMIKSYHLREA